jgi:hypothetical protein
VFQFIAPQPQSENQSTRLIWQNGTRMPQRGVPSKLEERKKHTNHIIPSQKWLSRETSDPE